MTHTYSRIGQHLGNYRLVQLLGEGGFAEVYLGQHLFLPRLAAIKILRMQVGQAEHQAFLQEAQTITKLEHPHIIRILDFGIDRDIPFLVMAYAPKGSLRTRFPSGPYALSDFLPYVEQVAQALDYAHQQRVIHRDIKPDNILLNEQNQALLSDFGISVVMSHTTSQSARDVIGTPVYMSPEQFRGRPKPASDQYSLGVVVYQLLSGQRPFQGDFAALGYQHTHEQPPLLHTIVQGISPQVERVVLKSLAKDPGERYDSVIAFAQALRQSLASASSTIFLTPAVMTSGKPLIPTNATAAIYDTPTEPAPHPEPVAKTISIHQELPEPHQEQYRELVSKECFICTYKRQLKDTQQYIPCVEMEISGHIVGLINNSTIVVSVDGTDERASVTLDNDYYSNFIRILREKGKSILKQPIIFYHLSKYSGQTISNGKICHQYVGDAYTLAVLEPDMLLNITNLSEADYCNRKYLLNRIVASPPSSHTMLGSIVHTCFTALLKEGQTTDEGSISESMRKKTVLQILQEHCEKALALKKLEIALANVSLEELRETIQPHLEHLANWYQANRNTIWGDKNNVRAETTLLAPKIGMRGRLDLYWQQASGQSLLELKTGSASGDSPKGEHRKQVNGYQSLLMVHDHVRLTKASTKLVYSGTPGQANAYGIPFDIRNVQRLNETRNLLVLSRITGVPPTPPGGKRCEKCSMQGSCTRVSLLLGWQPPIVDSHYDFSSVTDASISSTLHQQNQQQVDNENSQFFKYYYALLQLEGRAGEEDLKRLWKTKVEKRIEAGKAIDKLKLVDVPWISNHGWKQEFECDNQSELGEGDEILLSDGDPIHGNIVTGTILSISAKSVTVWTRERIDKPILIDLYGNDLVHIRTQKNLLRWLDTDPHLQDLVMRRTLPHFSKVNIGVDEGFNVEQREAIIHALQMQDYLLIQGPPGTGKTTVIAEIVRRLVQQGENVLLAAFTNQAVDNMLQRLQKEGVHDFIRIGHERSVDDSVKPRLLSKLFEDECLQGVSNVYDLLQSTPIIASTTATWSSEEYIQAGTGNVPSSSLFFDVAIIDEASQLTVPALLGALRFAKRFILVGDEKQLPPLVLSEEAEKQGLGRSLFSILKELPQSTNHSVMLKTQYRMHRVISNFPSTVFYNGELVPDVSVASRQLALNEPTPITNTSNNATEGKINIGEQAKPAILQVIHPNSPLVFLNTRDATYTSQQKSSLAEAKAVQDIIEALLRRNVKAEDIGIVAPYRAQVALIRRLLAQKFSDELLDSTKLVNTVDRFQGGEREVIIISFATTHIPTEKRLEFLTDPHRLNVALTRAKTKLILVGNVPALENLPIFSQLLRYCQSMKTVCLYDSGA